MHIRNFLIAAALLFPIGALADSSTAAQSDGSATGILGPSSAGGVSSSADGGVLQPAGSSPLQSTTQDASGLTPSSSSTLQAGSGNADQLKVLLGGEADGQGHDIAQKTSSLEPDLLILAAVLAFAATGYFVWRRRSHLKT